MRGEKKARGALMRKKPQIIKLLHQTLSSKEFKEYLVYPHEGDETVIERNQMDEPILIVMTGKHAATLVKNFGQQIIGLDGIYKLTKFSWPIWIIVVKDNGGHSWIIGVIAAPAESQVILSQGINLLCTYIRKEMNGEKWTPHVMIDKDKVEQRALEEVGWPYLLTLSVPPCKDLEQGDQESLQGRYSL